MVSLEDIKAVMAVLADIREKEAVIDDIISPVEDMYHMLGRYEVRPAQSSANTKDGSCMMLLLLRIEKVPLAVHIPS